MPVPDFQTLMRPLLEECASGEEELMSDVRDRLADRFGLTEEERAQRLPSGTAKTFNNRVGWAATYLYRTGLLARPRRSAYVITPRGREVLRQQPERVDLGVLSRFSEFEEFRSTTGRRQSVSESADGTGEASTPEERIEAAFRELQEALIRDLLERIHAMPAGDFEHLVLDVLHAMGYGDGSDDAVLHSGRSGDAGIDGVIRQDRLGLEGLYVQAKRWEGTVGRPVIQGFVGALQGARASRGVIVTASTFSADARDYAAAVTPRVVLIDGKRLAELMISYDVGVYARETYRTKAVDSDYFGSED